MLAGVAGSNVTVSFSGPPAGKLSAVVEIPGKIPSHIQVRSESDVE
jgi:hypothetical protein